MELRRRPHLAAEPSPSPSSPCSPSSLILKRLQQGLRLLHGLRPLLVAAVLWNLATWWKRPARLLLPHHGRLHPRRRHRQPARATAHTGTSGVDWEPGHQSLQSPRLLPHHRLRPRRASSSFLFKARRQRPPPLQGPRRHRPAALLHPLPCSSLPAPASPTPTAPTTARRAWASSCSSLVGTVPTAYALNHAVDPKAPYEPVRHHVSTAGRRRTLDHYDRAIAPRRRPRRGSNEHFEKSPQHKAVRALHHPPRHPGTLVLNIRDEAVSYGSLGSVPSDKQENVRNQMYLASESHAPVPQIQGCPKILSQNDIKIAHRLQGLPR